MSTFITECGPESAGIIEPDDLQSDYIYIIQPSGETPYFEMPKLTT